MNPAQNPRGGFTGANSIPWVLLQSIFHTVHSASIDQLIAGKSNMPVIIHFCAGTEEERGLGIKVSFIIRGLEGLPFPVCLSPGKFQEKLALI